MEKNRINMKTGEEKFYFENVELPLKLLSFWQWSCSDLLSNALRGILAEFIVASAIDALDSPREEWDSYDLETKKGLKIEIKSSSYLQSWEQNKLSKIIFSIRPTITWGSDNKRTTKKIRQSDIYIFCVLSHKEKSSVNPLDLSQWSFYILETSVLNRILRDQKTITLSSLIKLNPLKVKYDELKHKIEYLESEILGEDKIQ